MKKINSLFKTFIVVILMMTPMVFQAKNHDVKGMAKHIDKVYIGATPEILENKGNMVTVTIEAEFPPKYFHKKAVMNISPVLVYENGETELPSMNFIGEKVEGEGVVVSRKYGGAFTYTVSIPYQEDMYNSVLIVEPLVYVCKTVVHPNRESIIEHERFAACNTFLVAEGVINTANNIDKSSLKTAYAKPEMKENIATDKGDIFFMVNSDKVNWSIPLNMLVENKSAIFDLTSHITKGWNIKDIEIHGWASPEGPAAYNKELSDKRAMMTKEFLMKRLSTMAAKNNTHVCFKNINDINFVTEGMGPDWDGLMKAISSSNIKDKQMIVNTLKNQSEKQRIAQLNTYIKQYPEFKKDILPSLRRCVINVNTVEPMMTDEQITKKCTENPKSMSCDQMMYAATLVKDLNKKEQIYITAIETFPNNAEPYCNAGATAIEKGNIKHGKQLLVQAVEIDDLLAEAYNNLGIVAIYENNYKTAEKMFEKARKLGVNTSYNEGVVHINKGEYDKAAKLMTKDNPKCDYNVALAQTLDKKYTIAEETIKCVEEDGHTLYLQAVIASRTKNTEKAIKHLSKAIKKDMKMKHKAKTDMEFAYLKDDPDFLALVQ